MKSSEEQLKNRGFLPEIFNTEAYKLNLPEKLDLLKSKVPVTRTLAARLLKDENKSADIVDALICALTIEDKLYVKIEISEALASCGELAVEPLIRKFGKIGNNQHRFVPEKEFNKSSFPLPRDISARILSGIGLCALPQLLSFIKTARENQLSEAIDAIGFICFYKNEAGVFPVLKSIYDQNNENNLIKWKIIRACSGIPESLDFLKSEEKFLKNAILQNEIKRSIKLSMKKQA
jgi:hypothetical protein